MEWTVHPSRPRGTVRVPGSKSHAIRAVLCAALADGESVVRTPPDSHDVRAALVAARALGATIDDRDPDPDAWRIRGVAGAPCFTTGAPADVGNSGTTLFLAAAAAALHKGGGAVVFDGDEQLRRRSGEPLWAALRALGARVASEGGRGCCPVRVGGTLRGGDVRVRCDTSQYISALMLAAPLAGGNTAVSVDAVCERPYLAITGHWLDMLGVRWSHTDDWSRLTFPGGQRWRGFDRAVPGDWSSATFLLVAGALADGPVVIDGLDADDPQGDRRVVDALRAMGARIDADADAGPVRLTVRGGALRGREIDLSDMPDALPALAVAGCFADGVTRLVNVAHARRKETDRIAVMARELRALGADVRERPDGLAIAGGGLRGGRAHGHGDHRVVMALSVAGLFADAAVTVDTVESAAVTFPGFADALKSLGARVDGCGSD